MTLCDANTKEPESQYTAVLDINGFLCRLFFLISLSCRVFGISSQGTTGEKGAKGEKGNKGAIGRKGDPGFPGLTGEPGVKVIVITL